MRRPEPVTSMSASATSAMTRVERRRTSARPVPLPVLPSLSVPPSSGDAPRSAGRTPAAITASAVTTMVPRATSQPTLISLARGRSFAAAPLIHSPPQSAPMLPATAPAPTSTRLSARRSRASSRRRAPSAVRTASSRARVAARASERFATFTHAMRSTSATAPVRSRSCGPTLPITSADTGVRSTARHAPFSAGHDAASRAATSESARRAAAESTPARIRPITRLSACTPRWHTTAAAAAGPALSGAHSSAHTGYPKSSPITPTTVKLPSSSWIGRPTRAGSAPKRRRQSRSDSTATGGAPGRMSSAISARPRSAGSRSTRKKSSDT